MDYSKKLKTEKLRRLYIYHDGLKLRNGRFSMKALSIKTDKQKNKTKQNKSRNTQN